MKIEISILNGGLASAINSRQRSKIEAVRHCIWSSALRIIYAIGMDRGLKYPVLIGGLLLFIQVNIVFGQAECNCNYIVDKAGVYTNTKLGIKPGQTVCVKAGRYDFLRFNGFIGTAAQPIRFVNYGGQVLVGVDAYYSGVQFNASRYFILSGSGDAATPYGFKLDRSNQSASGVSIGGLSSDCEVEHVEVAYAGFAGFMIKTDPSCDSTTWRANFEMHNVLLHDNYVHDTGGEGFYVGHSYYTGVTITCAGNQKTVYPHLIYGLQVYNNRIEHTAAEGLQYGCAPDAQIHHNTLTYTGMAPFANYQNNGLQIGGGGGGDCYSNQITHVAGIGLIIIGHLGNNRIYNNVIYDASLDGIFCDDRAGSLDNTRMLFANNTINRTGRDGIRLYNQNNTNVLVNNAVTRFNAKGDQGGRAFTFMQGASATQLTNATSTGSTGFYANDSTDFQPANNSPLNKAGTDISNWGIITDLLGVSRTDVGKYDVGAYAYTPATAGGRLPAAELAPASGLVLFPSPAHTSITCEIPVGQSICHLLIYSQQATIVAEVNNYQQANSLRQSTEQLPPGVYTVVVRSSDYHTYYGRFIKS